MFLLRSFDVLHIVLFLCNKGFTILFSINIFLRFLRRLKYQMETQHFSEGSTDVCRNILNLSPS